MMARRMSIMIHIEKIIRQMFPYNWQQNYILVRDHISLRMQRTIIIFNSGPKSRFSAISNIILATVTISCFIVLSFSVSYHLTNKDKYTISRYRTFRRHEKSVKILLTLSILFMCDLLPYFMTYFCRLSLNTIVWSWWTNKLIDWFCGWKHSTNKGIAHYACRQANKPLRRTWFHSLGGWSGVGRRGLLWSVNCQLCVVRRRSNAPSSSTGPCGSKRQWSPAEIRQKRCNTDDLDCHWQNTHCRAGPTYIYSEIVLPDSLCPPAYSETSCVYTKRGLLTNWQVSRAD